MDYWPTTPHKSAPRSHKYFPCHHLPLTPAQTPTHGTKRAILPDSGYDPDTPCSKRLPSKAPRTPCKSPFRTDSIPKFSILYDERTSTGTKISALELKRASESMLSQVDWDVVEENVASNRRGSTFRKAIKKILQERVDDLFESEASFGHTERDCK